MGSFFFSLFAVLPGMRWAIASRIISLNVLFSCIAAILALNNSSSGRRIVVLTVVFIIKPYYHKTILTSITDQQSFHCQRDLVGQVCGVEPVTGFFEKFFSGFFVDE